MRFPLLHKKGLQTPANARQFNSVSWTHTLKYVLLGCSVLVLEADISKYSVYFHSLWNIKAQLLEEARFSLSESKGRFNSLRLGYSQQSSLKSLFFLFFRRRFTAISEMLAFDWKNGFSACFHKGFTNSCKHTSVYLCRLNAHIEGRSVILLRFGFRSRYFSIPRLLPFTVKYQNAAPGRNTLLSLWI